MGRAPCCDKENVKKGPWAPEEDAKLKTFIEKYGTGGNWIALPQKAGLKRCGKSCRLRWLNYLRPNIKHGEFTDDEDKIICSLYANIGSRWSIIAAQLPGRTDNDIKNYWNTKLKKKLLAMLPSFQKKPSFFPSLPLQSPVPQPYRSSQMLFTNNSSPFYNNYSTPTANPNFMYMNNNNMITPLAQDHIVHHPSDANSLISLITNINNNNNDQSSFNLGFQGDDQIQSMYNNNSLEFQMYPTSDVKEAMLMFGSGGTEGHDQVSTTGSSSEGGSSLSQISCSKIKKENQFSLQGFGDQSQSFLIDHNNYSDLKPKGYNLEEVKELTNNISSSYLFINKEDEYKTTHDYDHKEICYDYC